MVYNFNLGIGWASSGVEYAQAYRGKVFRQLNIPAKFIFTDMFRNENIEHMTKNIGFQDDEVIWLYQYFTDFKIAPTTFSREQLEKTFTATVTSVQENKEKLCFVFKNDNMFINAYLTRDGHVFKTEIVSGGYLIRADYYSYAKMFSEFYAPSNGKAVLYLRRFYNEDGSEAYEEMIEEGKKEPKELFRLGELFFYSKEQFVRHFIKSLGFTEQDVIVADRTTQIGQAIFAEHKPARLAIVVHADHFNEEMTDEDYILWNNYYEYDFAHLDDLAFCITSTDVQRQLMQEQFFKYSHKMPHMVTIPVGSLKELRHPAKPRRRHALVTASRLATEKHVDWIAKAVVKARAKVPDIQLDIYGQGGEDKTIRKVITDNHAEEYIHLRGHQDLTEVYEQYEGYVAASTSEGFGLTLMEAVGAGLPMIGYDVRYGNQTFIDNEKNGYLIPVFDRDINYMVDALAEGIIRLFTEADIESFSKRSYEIAEDYLDEKVRDKWNALLGEK